MTLNERYRDIYARLYGFKDHCDEQHHHVIRELEKELALSSEKAEPSVYPQFVWGVESKTTFAVFATEEDARRYVSSFSASIGGGMNIAKLTVLRIEK